MRDKIQLSFLGNGNMASALISKLSQIDKFSIRVIGRDIAKLNKLQEAHKNINILTYDELESIENDNIILCVKPNNLNDIHQKLDGKGRATNTISVLAGVELNSLKQNINSKFYARVMPNVGAKIAKSTTAIYADNDSLSALCVQIFEYVGSCVVLGSDDDIDIATGVVGSAPAFLCEVFEGICKEAINLGLDSTKSKELTNGLFASFSALISQPNTTPQGLKDAITSPNGTTYAGLKSLEANKAQEIFKQAIKSAYDRAKELQEQSKK